MELNRKITDEKTLECYTISGITTNSFCSGIIPETIGQFTGLNDRNGKEIYEGDIIKVNTWYHNLVPFDHEYKYEEEKGYATYLVKWDDRSCEFYLEYINHTKIEPRCKILKIHRAQEVIGCIHD